MAKTLFQTNINAINKVRSQLMLSQTMTYRQVILGEGNKKKLEQAQKHLYDAVELLKQIQ